MSSPTKIAVALYPVQPGDYPHPLVRCCRGNDIAVNTRLPPGTYAARDRPAAGSLRASAPPVPDPVPAGSAGPASGACLPAGRRAAATRAGRLEAGTRASGSAAGVPRYFVVAGLGFSAMAAHDGKAGSKPSRVRTSATSRPVTIATGRWPPASCRRATPRGHAGLIRARDDGCQGAVEVKGQQRARVHRGRQLKLSCRAQHMAHLGLRASAFAKPSHLSLHPSSQAPPAGVRQHAGCPTGTQNSRTVLRRLAMRSRCSAAGACAAAQPRHPPFLRRGTG